MDKAAIIEAIKKFGAKVLPAPIATLLPESWLPEAPSVEKIMAPLFGKMDELEDLAANKLLEQGDLQREMEDLEMEKAAAVDQQIRAENFATNLDKLFAGEIK